MAYVVTDECEDCKYTYCAVVCPVAAFREGINMLYIDPEICIDCNACVPECPVEAIYSDIDLPTEKEKWVEINAQEAPKYPEIEAEKEPLLGPKCIDPNAG